MNKLSIPLLVLLAGCSFPIAILPGRPLRIEGEPITTEVRAANAGVWAQGLRPDASRLDESTRQALAKLWLEDARGEHASIPAFSRISWQLAALGAPPELIAQAHQAAIEEIGHARLCFALAEGYSGEAYQVEPIPQMLQGGLEVSADPIASMAEETLFDGCLMEGFFAELAARALSQSAEPAVQAALAQIAKEEKSHADFSWALLKWLRKQNPQAVEAIIQNGIKEFPSRSRPKAPSRNKGADPQLLMQHGKLPDGEWQEVWDRHIANLQEDLQQLLKS